MQNWGKGVCFWPYQYWFEHNGHIKKEHEKNAYLRSVYPLEKYGTCIRCVLKFLLRGGYPPQNTSAPQANTTYLNEFVAVLYNFPTQQGISLSKEVKGEPTLHAILPSHVEGSQCTSGIFSILLLGKQVFCWVWCAFLHKLTFKFVLFAPKQFTGTITCPPCKAD